MPRWPNRTDEERFWNADKVDRSGRCWVWLASTNSDGYGQFKMDGKMQKAHRVAWLLSVGVIPDGVCVCHSCDNPPCVNPEHLFLGSIQENMDDRGSKGRSRGGSLRGDKHPNVSLTEAQVLEIRGISGGESQRSIARRYSVSGSVISNVINRVTWTHI